MLFCLCRLCDIFHRQDIDYLEQSADKIRTMLDDMQSQYEKQNVNVQSKEKFSLDTNVEDTKNLSGDSKDRVAKLNSLNEVKFSKNTKYDASSALTAEEIIKYNKLVIENNQSALRVSENAFLVESEKGKTNYKLVFFDNSYDDKPITAIYGIGDNSFHMDIAVFDARKIADVINEIEEKRYDNEKFIRRILRNLSNSYGLVLRRYRFGNKRQITIRPNNLQNSSLYNEETSGRGHKEFFEQNSRNTRLTLDDNIEDVNEAFLSTVKVLQNVHIDDIDLSSEVVNKAEKAAKHIQDEVKKSGYRTQKMTGKGSVRSIATELSEKYGDGKVTKSVVNRLAELYDYIANSEATDMGYINSQAKNFKKYKYTIKAKYNV